MIRPKNSIVEGVEQVASPGSAWTPEPPGSPHSKRPHPIPGNFAQRDCCGTPMRHREEHRKGHPADCRIGGNRAEIERDQPRRKLLLTVFPAKK